MKKNILTVVAAACICTALSTTPAEAAKKHTKVPVKTTTTQSAVYNHDLSIMGEAMATEAQAIKFIKDTSPQAKLTCSVEDIVKHYFAEAKKEGIRGDVALSQALLETGFFSYQGAVKYNQNNFCGLGSTGPKVPGEVFPNAQIGVRAHIQHLLAYSSKKEPSEKLVDPRFKYVKNNPRVYGQAKTWHDLDGRWAMSKLYGKKILDIHNRMLQVKAVEPVKPIDKPEDNKPKTKKSLQERIASILAGGK